MQRVVLQFKSKTLRHGLGDIMVDYVFYFDLPYARNILFGHG
jgi:hypothetical protein